MEHRELKKLVQLMNDNGLVELEIERDGERVHLRKAGPPVATAYAGMPMGAPPGAVPTPVAEETAPEPEGATIDSPMVGTFYRRPSPDSDPYVNVGDHIDDESVVCLVEAMKVNNEIKAELSGEILEVLVEDGEPVEYGQPLFRVRVS